MKLLDFIGHEIRDTDEVWIIAGNLIRIEAMRQGNKVVAKDKKWDYEIILHEGKNSRIDLQRSWIENYMITKPLKRDL